MFLEPIFAPMGWDWRAVVALLFGFIAKEIVVGTFGTLYGIEGGGDGLQNALLGSFTPVSAYAYMAFVLIYVPCLATIATIKAETGSWKWPLLAMAYLMGLAFLVALIISLAGDFLMGVFG
jgi:ferrous iron transport protein B